LIKIRSLRARIILINSGILAAVLLLFSVMVYYRFKHHVEAAEQIELEQDVRRVSGHVLENYQAWQSHGLEEKLDAYTPPDGSGHYLSIKDSSGRIIYQSRDVRWRALLAQPSFVPPSVGQFESVRGERPLTILHASYRPPNGPQFDLLAASSTRNSDALSGSVFLTLVVLDPLMLLVASVIGILLMDHELRPVMTLRSQADSVGRGGLGSRLSIPETGDELESLGHTLNEMIERLEDALAYNMKYTEELSHEIRTPLAIIRMEIEELAELPDVSGVVQSRAGSALEEIAGLSTMIDRVLSLARLDSGGDLVPFVRLDLSPLVAEIIEQMRLLYEVQGVTVRLNASESAWVMGDGMQLKRAIANLLGNAVKYTLRGGSVEVDIHTNSRAVVMSVRDTGIGISEADLSKIFIRFFRTSAASTSARSGFGLGLAMVKTVCEQHGGSISATSTMGSGSTFTVSLPVAS
jgi:signal transduction histidine kinase